MNCTKISAQKISVKNQWTMKTEVPLWVPFLNGDGYEKCYKDAAEYRSFQVKVAWGKKEGKLNVFSLILVGACVFWCKKKKKTFEKAHGLKDIQRIKY